MATLRQQLVDLQTLHTQTLADLVTAQGEIVELKAARAHAKQQWGIWYHKATAAEKAAEDFRLRLVKQSEWSALFRGKFYAARKRLQAAGLWGEGDIEGEVPDAG